MKRAFCYLVAMVVLAVGSSVAGAQSQQPSSLGDYARAVKKTQAPAKAPAKVVYDNDNLPADGSVSVVGRAPAQDATADASQTADQSKDATDGAAKADNSVKPGQTPEEQQKAMAAWKVKIDDQKSKISLLTREFDVLQKEHDIKASEFYSNTANQLKNASFSADDAKFKQQIADKKKDLDAAQTTLNTMQEEARKSGVPNSVAK